MILKSSFRRAAAGARFPVMMEPCEPRQLLSADVLMYHNNVAQTGANTAETILNRSNVNSSTFGKKLSLPVQGQVYVQPLYVSHLKIPNQGVHNVVYVATEHDQVYAFDADTGAQLWHFSAIKKGQTTIPFDDTGTDDISPEIGITSTPVIDKVHGAIYFVAEMKITANSTYATRLYSLNLTTGTSIHQPANINASSAGSGDGSSGGNLNFQPLIENQRSALTLSNGVIYIAFASHGDLGPYHGWVLGYNATNLRLVSNWNATPDGGMGGIWMSGGAPAIDSKGNVYVAIGNGTFDADSGGSDYGDSIVRLPTKGSFTPADSFTPFDQADLEANDKDFGSTGVLILPIQGGAHPHELLVGGKEGNLYLVDRDNMGGFNNGFDDVVQTVQADGRHGGFDTPAYYSGRIYYASSSGSLEAFTIKNGVLSHVRKTSAETYSFPGANPVVSANGSRNGIVWVIGQTNDGRAQLEAYNSMDLTQQLYTSEQAGARDQATGDYVKFTSATVADGHAFVGTDGHLEIYGLL